jgi:hypothetical protein
LREWAEKREVKASDDLKRGHQMGDLIPSGQPVLVGHHSERRDRRYRARIVSTIDRGLEHAEKASDFNHRAAAIESQLAGSIYSDDPDAIEQLESRLSILEAERDRIKAYNASCRKGQPDTGLLDETQREDLNRVARCQPYALRPSGAFPSYGLTNLSGNIARIRKRLEFLRSQLTIGVDA